MKKRFIVLIDFSDHSKRLLQLAYNWIKNTDLTLLLVNHVDQPTPAMGDPDVISELKDASSQQAMKTLRHFAQTAIGDDPALQYAANTSNLISIIEELQTPDTTDFVFVGLNDKTLFDQLLFGSTAAELSKQLNSVILAFPTGENAAIELSNIYIGVNERFPLNKPALQELLYIRQDVIREFCFFSIVKGEEEAARTEENLQALKSQYEYYINTSYEVLLSEDPTEAVKDFMLKNKGVLVIQKGSRSLMDLFRPFFTTEMIYMARVPLIILPNSNTH